MSGGHWDYEAHRLENAGSLIGEDKTVLERWPKMAHLFQELCFELAKCEHDMDWDICSDKSIPDDRKWELDRIVAMLNIVLQAAPDEWFPRGKSATIQAIAERHTPTKLK